MKPSEQGVVELSHRVPSERVDTRVLQVVFKAGASQLPLYVGQQVDVFMEALPRPSTPVADAGPVSQSNAMDSGR